MNPVPPGLNVAIVDDEPSVRTSLTRLLRSSGVQVESFVSGDAFVERLADGPWHIVLLDIHMPGLTGFEVLKRIREERRDLAVIMITGYEGGDVRRSALEAGARDVLLKPFSYSDFLDAVRALSAEATEARG